MRIPLTIIALLILNYVTGQKPQEPLLVRQCHDFDVTGKGDNFEWGKTRWNNLSKLDSGGKNYESKFKILYSSTGIYLLFSGKDNKITTKFDQDFENLFEGDVFEAFFHTNTRRPIYLEYEINQLNKELVLIIPNFGGDFYGWIPWHYENERRMKKMVYVDGGKMEKNAVINSWRAELFFPYKLFNPLENLPPKSGTIWNANFYRLDYDSGKGMKWSWSPIKNSFHEFEKFWPIKFE
ncbi:carbohydrate-binding family 9-like protein [Segetibacter koreensis]|uniref:carbohydrate-binding family 9-like protein n=1 Tax=Segetibacter koreensis TaxID=398037 RepID=UPI000377F1EF|nr:carbohydrate-binding family 9-like protein [Segetibacter koreensis]